MSSPRPTLRERGALSRAAVLASSIIVLLLALAPTPASAEAPNDCAGGAIGLSFSSAAVTGTVNNAGPSTCYVLSAAASGDVIALRTVLTNNNTAVDVSILDGNGQTTCSFPWWSSANSCTLTGAEGWKVVVTQTSADTTGGYRLTARRLNSPTGCAAFDAPAAFSFTAARTNGSIDSASGTRCYQFTRGAADADETLWLRTARTSGTLAPTWSVISPTGGIECGGSSLDYAPCVLRASGTYAILIEDASFTGTGGYWLTAKRSSSPAGCAELPSVAFGSAPSTGTLSSIGEVDCWTTPELADGDRVRVTAIGTGVEWRLLDDAGQAVCSGSYTHADCQVPRAGRFTLVVFNQDPSATPSYTASIRKLSSPAGCSSGELSASGAFAFGATRTNGTISGAQRPNCYTFTRPEGTADAAYWFRVARTSGLLNPKWELLGPSGSRECSNDYSADEYAGDCVLRASGTFTLVIRDDQNTNSGSYFFTAQRTSAPTGCTDAGLVAYGAAGLQGAITVGGEIDCLRLTGVELGDTIDPGLSVGRYAIVDGDGVLRCRGYGGEAPSGCKLTGAADWTMLVYDSQPGTTGTYVVAPRKLNVPSGCSALTPEDLRFTTARKDGSITGPLRPTCYRFSRAAGEPDGRYWVSTIRTSGNLTPTWRIYDADGTLACSGYSWSRDCSLRASGDFTLVVDDSSRVQTGTFYATLKRVTQPEGCSAMGSVALTVPRSLGRLQAGGEVDCFAFPGVASDQFTLNATGTPDRMNVVNAAGDTVCQGWGEFSCTLSGDAPYALLVESTSGATGNYNFSGTCTNVPCGQADTGLVDVTPKSLGASEAVSVTIRGRDLDLLESAKFVRNGQTIPVVLSDAAPDGRTRLGRVNTLNAGGSGWDLEGTFIDGSVRTLTKALNISVTIPASVKTSIVGRPAFRVGTPTSFTIQLSNSGNVDAVGVPVFVGGFPENATLTPEFQLHKVTGPGASPAISATTYDAAADSTVVDGRRVATFFAARVPANGSLQLRFSLSVPTATPFTLRALNGACWDDAPTGDGATGRAGNLGGAAASCGISVGTAIADVALESVPGGSCISMGVGFVGDAAKAAANNESMLSWSNVAGWGLGAANCGISFVPGMSFAKGALKAAGTIWGLGNVAKDCFDFGKEAGQAMLPVASFDPNDIIGPAGAGSARYLTGEGEQQYQVLFENLPAATAPAQRVEITDQLDVTKFDPATVKFRDVRFGTTVHPIAVPTNEVHETIDLRPAQNLLVKADATVSDSGLVRWVLQAIDPDTLQAPEDALVGFLPPNTTSPQGEGQVSFTVSLRDLPAGTRIDNEARIIFDANAPIDTPVWSNTIDKSPPTASIDVETSGPLQAKVSWSGTDDAAGIAGYEVRAAKSGQSSQVWKVAETAGAATFTAETPGAYVFRVLAYDGAGNAAQSRQVSVEIAAAPGDGGNKPGGEQPGTQKPQGQEQEPPASGSSPPATPQSPPATAKPEAPVVAWSSAKKVLTVSSKRMVSTGALATCTGAGPDCSVTVSLLQPAKSKKKKPVELAVAGPIKVAAGAAQPITSLVTSSALKAIKKQKVKATLLVTVTRGGLTAKQTREVTLAAEPKKGKRKG